VAENGVIRGTREYNKDEFVSGAKAATSSKVFPAWNEGGKVFYKVREHAIDPLARDLVVVGADDREHRPFGPLEVPGEQLHPDETGRAGQQYGSV